MIVHYHHVLLVVYTRSRDITLVVFFFFKQKTAYEMRISDWSSDVCSSDLRDRCDSTGHSPWAPSSTAPAGREGATPWALRRAEIGRASCRERVCQYV